jgi:class 3 adenylate cyclase/tetratricopeptide (TPR) repeat protein
MNQERFLATVLFTDIAGSTQRAAHAGDRRWRELLERHHEIVRRELRRHGGEERATAGDGFLATFEDPADAILCAWTIRDAVRGLGLDVRSGVHIGQVERMGKDVGGLAVHTGARVAAAARGGEILVSSTVRDAEAGSAFVFDDRGTHELKGVPGEWRLYAVTGAPVEAAVPADARSKLPWVLGLYVLAALVVLGLTAFLQSRFELPPWTVPGAVVLLAVGLVMMYATARAQAGPASAPGGPSETVPGSWELDLPDVGRSVAKGRLPHLTWSRSILGGAVAFSLLFGLAGLYVLVQDRGRTFTPREAVAEGASPAVAVLPFSVRGEGLDVWREGMVDVLSTNLDGAGGFRAIDSRTVLARWRERVSGESVPDLSTSLAVARAAGARFAVVGNALTTGPDVRFEAAIYDTEGGETLGRVEAVGPPDSVLGIANRLSLDVLRSILQEPEAEVPWRDVASLTTSSVPALKAYLRGEALYRRSDFEGASLAYRDAVAADSTFALALYRLGDTYGWIQSIGADLVHEYYGRAVRLIDRLPEREAMLLRGLQAFDEGSLTAFGLMQQAVQRYPDDPEAWFLLGDVHYHLATQALADPRDGERAMERAVELDPDFSTYYLHLVEYAVFRGDSAAAAERHRTYERLAPGTPDVAALRVLLDLTFGDPQVREAARAASDTAGSITTIYLALGLRSPENAADLGRVLTTWRNRPGASPTSAVLLAWSDITRGRVRAASELLDDPVLTPPIRAAVAFRLLRAEPPGIDAKLDGVLGQAQTDSTTDLQTFYAGLWAAERGRWADHEAALRRLTGHVERARAAGDTATARFTEGARLGVQGWGLWRKGQREPALKTLQDAQRRATGYALRHGANATLRSGIAELLLEMSRPEEARPYLSSLVADHPSDALASRRLGKVFEELDEPAKAREAYERFAILWKDADPELQPRVAEARAAVQRLSSAVRE